MTRNSFSRQLATAVAAFFLTALLVLANAPVEQHEEGLRLRRDQLSPRVFTVLPQQHG